MKRSIIAASVVVAVALTASTCAQVAEATHPAESQRVYPTQIDGHLRTGWHVAYSDGHQAGFGSWAAIRDECSHDANPAVCTAVWRTFFHELGVERAIIHAQAE